MALLVAILVLAAIGGSAGSRSQAIAAPSPSSTAVSSNVALATEASASADFTAPQTTAQSSSPARPPASSSASSAADPSAVGPSFEPDATGVLSPLGGASELSRLAGEPDPGLTPGALNPAVTQATIGSTICVSGWTTTIRPSESLTDALKIKQIGQYGYGDTKTSSYEEDHLISLELGGAPADPRNLWPEPYTVSLPDGRPAGAQIKDTFETKLKTQVCSGGISLSQAQSEIGDHWVHAYYGITASSPTATPALPGPTVAAPTFAATANPAPPAPLATDPYADAKAKGATAVCADGSLSFSPSRSGTCSGHGGVHWWTGNVGSEGPGAH